MFRSKQRGEQVVKNRINSDRTQDIRLARNLCIGVSVRESVFEKSRPPSTSWIINSRVRVGVIIPSLFKYAATN